MRSGGCLRLVILVICAPWLVAAAQAACPETDAARLLKALPNAEAVIVVNNAATHRATPAGRGLFELLSPAGNFARTRASWADLAQRLGWTSDEAFDLLLGRRVTIVLRGLDEPGGPDWALMTEVSMETERRLRTRLAAVPRRNLSGFAVLCIEDGSCEIAVGRSAPAGARAENARPTGVTVLFGPGGGRLFEELAPSLLPQTRRELASASEAADIVCMVRRSESVGAPRFLALTADATATGWRARVVTTPGVLWGVPASPPGRWNDAPFRAMERDALVAIMSVAGSLPADGSSEIPHITGLIPAVPQGLRAELQSQRSALLIREASGPSATPDSRPALVARAAPVRTAATREPQAKRPLLISVALESSEPRRMVVDGDRNVAILIASLQSGRPITAAPIQMEVGVPDSQARVLPLEQTLESNPSMLETLVEIFGPEPTLRWGLTPPHTTGTAGGQTGWWVATLGHSAWLKQDGLAAALTRSSGGTSKRRISLGAIRPAALLRSSGDAGAGFLAPLQDYRNVELLRWDAWVRDDGLVEGEIILKLEN